MLITGVLEVAAYISASLDHKLLDSGADDADAARSVPIATGTVIPGSCEVF